MLERFRKGIWQVRNHHQMNMVRHQTVADQCQAVQRNALSQQIEINLAISIGIKDVLPSVASLSHVVWHAGGNHTGQTRHAPNLILNNDPMNASSVLPSRY
jgi:hypothetical protein